MAFNRLRGRGKRGTQASAPGKPGLDFYLKIDGIEGESEDKTHAKEISVMDFQISGNNPGASPVGRGGGKVEFADVGFVMELDKALIGCLIAGTAGKHIKTAVLTGRKSGGGQQDYLKWTFSDLILSSVRIHDPGSKFPTVFYISFNFTQAEVEYKEQKADGSLGAPIKASFNLAEGVK